MNKGFISMLMILSTCSLAQSKEYNRKVIRDRKDWTKVVPEELCLPAGMQISWVFTSDTDTIDFNTDGRNDFLCVVSNIKKEIGSQDYLYFYKQETDSSFTLFKKFDNVYPLDFDFNQARPFFKDKKLEKIYDCYGEASPLYSLTIKNDTIKLVKHVDAITRTIYEYVYSSKVNDWSLFKQYDMYNGSKYGGIDSYEDVTFDKGELLSKFRYCEEE